MFWNDEEFLAKRNSSMQEARRCRSFLMEKHGYSLGDARLNEAVGKWVRRARNFHAIGLGRKPLFEKFTMIDGGEVRTGKLFARPVPQNPATYQAKGQPL